VAARRVRLHVFAALVVLTCTIGVGPGMTAADAPRATPPPSGLADVSCASASLCVATAYGSSEPGAIVTSTDPTGGAATWKTSLVEPSNEEGWYALTCRSVPTRSLCVAVDSNQNILTSTHPTNGPGAWKAQLHAPVDDHIDVSCPDLSLCVVGASDGLLYSTLPTGGRRAWKSTSLFSGGNSLSAVSCPSASLCVAFGGPIARQSVFTSRRPTGGPPAWMRRSVPFEVGAAGTGALSCATQTLCVALVGDGLAASTNPTGGSRAWHIVRVELPTNDRLSTVSCPSQSLCVALTLNGEVLTSTGPTRGASPWRVSNLTVPGPILGLSCPSASLCVAVGASLQGSFVLTTTDPAGGASTWVPALLK
jgi:hypothetical protein